MADASRCLCHRDGARLQFLRGWVTRRRRPIPLSETRSTRAENRTDGLASAIVIPIAKRAGALCHGDSPGLAVCSRGSRARGARCESGASLAAVLLTQQRRFTSASAPKVGHLSPPSDIQRRRSRPRRSLGLSHREQRFHTMPVHMVIFRPSHIPGYHRSRDTTDRKSAARQAKSPSWDGRSLSASGRAASRNPLRELSRANICHR